MLKASLSFCRGMFAGGLREMEQEEVQIQGVSYNAMCKILNFIYTSELELSLNNVQEILTASCQLQVRAGGSKRCTGDGTQRPPKGWGHNFLSTWHWANLASCVLGHSLSNIQVVIWGYALGVYTSLFHFRGSSAPGKSLARCC